MPCIAATTATLFLIRKGFYFPGKWTSYIKIGQKIFRQMNEYFDYALFWTEMRNVLH